MKLTLIQEKIKNTQGNLIVRASEGTGKTHTMVSKMEKEIKENKSHKVMAGITFTIKAANEIRERLAIDATQHFIGTNNSFAIEEIIKPFMKDVYGESFDIDMGTDYSVKINSFRDAVKEIQFNSILPTYEENAKNFIFELALKIVINSEACRMYLKSKYFKLYIDEYQDCDKDMHKLFMYLADELKIDTFVVGDEKQSIYTWRGAYPEAFKSIWDKENFETIFMGDNFRSCQQIQNFTNLLIEDTRPLYQPTTDSSDIIWLDVEHGIDKWEEVVQDYLDIDDEFAILRFSNQNASIAADLMNSHGTDCVFIPQLPIANITTESAWLYMSVAQYCIFKHYSVYDFISEIPVESEESRRKVSILNTLLEEVKETVMEEPQGLFYENFSNLANYLNYSVKESSVKKLHETIVNKEFHVAFEPDKYNHVAITFHSSKGLEFEQVVLFAEDYWLDDMASIYNLYVASSRAKNKLIIVRTNHWAANKFEKNITTIFSGK